MMKASELAEFLTQFPDADVFVELGDTGAFAETTIVDVGASGKNILIHYTGGATRDPAVIKDLRDEKNCKRFGGW